MKKLKRVFLVFLFAAATIVASSPQAHALVPPIVTYDVNRSFFGAALTGTLEIPIGNYTLQNQPPSPFTSVDLTLTVNGSSYAVNNVLTDLIKGTGEFTIEATSTTLTFGTANADGLNPADLVFSDNFDSQSNNKYAIGSNGAPQFEVAYTDAGDVVNHDLSFPLTFAVVPEPTTLSLLGLGWLALVMLRRRR